MDDVLSCLKSIATSLQIISGEKIDGEKVGGEKVGEKKKVKKNDLEDINNK